MDIILNPARFYLNLLHQAGIAETAEHGRIALGLEVVTQVRIFRDSGEGLTLNASHLEIAVAFENLLRSQELDLKCTIIYDALIEYRRAHSAVSAFGNDDVSLVDLPLSELSDLGEAYPRHEDIPGLRQVRRSLAPPSTSSEESTTSAE